MKGLLLILTIILGITFWLSAVYIVFHFVVKFW